MVQEAMTNAGGQTPSDDGTSIGLCWECSRVSMIFRNPLTGRWDLRKPTEAEQYQIDHDADMLRMLAAMRVAKQAGLGPLAAAVRAEQHHRSTSN